MPLDTTYSGGGRTSSYAKKDNHPTTYSQYKLYNGNSKIDPSALNFNYWNGLLKIEIAPKKNTNDDTTRYDYENAIAMHLSVSKAFVFKKEIERFLQDPKGTKSAGVVTPKGVIYVSDGSEFGSDNIFLVIKLIDAESSKVTASACYEFNTDYHFSVRNCREEGTFQCDYIKEDYNKLEVQQLLIILDTYINAMTSATAASVIDASYFRFDKIDNTVNAVAEKLGVEIARKTPNSYSSRSSFFNPGATNAISGSKPSGTTYSDYESLDLD